MNPVRRTTVRLLILALALAACSKEGPTGPTGPAGATGASGPAGAVGPQGPAGAGVSYQVFEGAITSATMSTASVNTAGVVPGVVCYISNNATTWLEIATDTYSGAACGVQQSGSSYQGRALLPTAQVNTGWTVRIILFWKP